MFCLGKDERPKSKREAKENLCAAPVGGCGKRVRRNCHISLPVVPPQSLIPLFVHISTQLAHELRCAPATGLVLSPWEFTSVLNRLRRDREGLPYLPAAQDSTQSSKHTAVWMLSGAVMEPISLLQAPWLSSLLPCMGTCITRRCIHGTLSMETISACQLLGRVVWKFSCHFALYDILPWISPSVKDSAVFIKTENKDLHTPTTYCLFSVVSGRCWLELNFSKWLLSRQKQRYRSSTFSLWHVERIIPGLNLKISSSLF